MASKEALKLLVEELKQEDVFFHDPFRNAWVQFQKGNHKEVCPVNSDHYKNRIYALYIERLQETPTENDLKFAASICEAYAKYECVERNLYLRLAEIDSKIYYDLTNENREIVEVDTTGYQIINSDSILFQRYDFQNRQDYPVDTGGKIIDLLKYLNISKDDSLLFIVYLISCFIPDIQHPILLLHGESGSGKSTISSIVKELVDPCAFDVTSLPDDDEDFFLVISQNWVTVFDNVTKISSKQSDNLCKVATGIASLKRTRYTDKHINVTKVLGCIILNCVHIAAEKEDLLNRCLLFKVTNIAGWSYKLRNEIFEQFKAEKPKILHCIFRIISRAMALYPTIDHASSCRMAEFEKYGYAIAEAIKSGKGEEFINLLKKNIETQENEAIAENTLLNAIIRFMQKRNSWHGSPTELLHELNRTVNLYSLNARSETMPKSPEALTKKLNSHVGLLRRHGVEYAHNGHTSTGSKITLTKH